MLRFNRLLLASSLFLAPPLANTTLYDSTASTGSEIYRVSVFTNNNGVGPAFSFTNTTAGTLADVKLSLQGVGTGTGSVTITLYSNNPTGPQPASALCTVGTVVDSSINGTVLQDFPVSSGCALAANTRYWIMLTSTNESNLYFVVTASSAGTGVAGEFSDLDGVTAPNTTSNNVTIGSVTSAPGGTTTSVPVTTPFALLLTILGLACVGAWMASRRSAQIL